MWYTVSEIKNCCFANIGSKLVKFSKESKVIYQKMYDLVHLVHSKTKNEHSSIVVRMNVEKEVL